MNSRPSQASLLLLNSSGSPSGAWQDTKKLLQLQVGSSGPNGGSLPLPTHTLGSEIKHGVITANDCYPFSQMDQPAHSVCAWEAMWAVASRSLIASFVTLMFFCFLIYKMLFMVHLWFLNQVLIYCSEDLLSHRVEHSPSVLTSCTEQAVKKNTSPFEFFLMLNAGI